MSQTDCVPPFAPPPIPPAVPLELSHPDPLVRSSLTSLGRVARGSIHVEDAVSAKPTACLLDYYPAKSVFWNP